MPRALTGMSREELIYQLRGVGTKRHGPRSLERRLMHAAADMLEEGAGSQEPEERELDLSVEEVEELIGGKLLPWQKRNLSDS